MDRPYLLLLVVDCLRADRTYGEAGGARIPTLGSVVARGTAFTRAFSSAANTTPAASMHSRNVIMRVSKAPFPGRANPNHGFLAPMHRGDHRNRYRYRYRYRHREATAIPIPIPMAIPMSQSIRQTACNAKARGALPLKRLRGGQ